MFEILKTIFLGDSTTTFLEFYKKMINWRKNKVYPFEYNLPNKISFPPEFWEDIFKIYRETQKDGKERAISVFWADGELILTSVVKGDETSVKSNHNISVKYSPHPVRKEYLRKEVILDNKTIKKKDMYYKKVPKEVIVQYLFNMHTHPPTILSDGTKKYSFFSAQDIHSLLSSGAILTGLVTDKVYLLVRTSETPSSVKIVDQDIWGIEYVKQNLKLGVYVANFNSKAVKQ